MRTLEQLLAEQYKFNKYEMKCWKELNNNVYEKITNAIREGMKEALQEAAERGGINEVSGVDSFGQRFTDYTVDKQSILKLIDEIK